MSHEMRLDWLKKLVAERDALKAELHACKLLRDNYGNRFERLMTDLTRERERSARLREALEFYANPESWMVKDKDSWRTASPRAHGDDQTILNYKHPNTDWTGTVVVGGKRAREALLAAKQDETK